MVVQNLVCVIQINLCALYVTSKKVIFCTFNGKLSKWSIIIAVRYKIVDQRRALDLASLASGTDESSINDNEIASNSSKVTVDARVQSSSDGHGEQALKSRMFCLYDVEKLDSKVEVSVFEIFVLSCLVNNNWHNITDQILIYN